MKFRFITVGVERITSSRTQEMFKTIDIDIPDEYMKEFNGKAMLGVEYIPEEIVNAEPENEEPEAVPPTE